MMKMTNPIQQRLQRLKKTARSRKEIGKEERKQVFESESEKCKGP
jgi:hypothetical protein